MEAKKCVVCGNPFTSRQPNRLTCSKRCRLDHRARLAAEWRKKNVVTVNCAHCGQPFTRGAGHSRKMCSDRCRDLAWQASQERRRAKQAEKVSQKARRVERAYQRARASIAEPKYIDWRDANHNPFGMAV